MAPRGRKRVPGRTSTRKPRTTTHYKKRLKQPKISSETSLDLSNNIPKSSISASSENSPSSSNISSSTDHHVGDGYGINYAEAVSNGGCCTPKGQRYRIPDISTCPPAPKKQRSVVSSNCSLIRRKPIAFFAPPDIELFFFFAFRDIPV